MQYTQLKQFLHQFSIVNLIYFVPVILASVFFLLLRITNIGIWISDTNIYFYTAYQLLQGKILYKDIFFTNLPLFPYISIIYFFLGGKNLALYYITASFEVVITTFFLYALVFKKTKDHFIATISGLVYMFSFIVLSTSIHQNGVLLASLFSVVSYYFLDTKHYRWAGIFAAMSFLTKAYFFPVILAFIVSLLVARERKLNSFLITFFLTISVLLIPSLFFARHEFIQDLFGFALTRPQQISKMELFNFFIAHDYILTFLFLFSILAIQRNVLIGLVSLFTLLFLLLYKDTYYLYLNMCIPFLCLSFKNLHLFIKERISVDKKYIAIVTLPLLFLNIVMYIGSFREYEKIIQINDIVSKIVQEHPSVLYGSAQIAPALAYLTNTPLLDSIIDTNPDIFARNILDKNILTQEAITQKALIITKGTLITPTLGDRVRDGIFDKKKLEASCHVLQDYPVEENDQINRINLWRCY